jgi:hypothetical protein
MTTIENEVGAASMSLKLALDRAEEMSPENPDFKSLCRRLLLHLEAFSDKYPEVGLKEEHFGEDEEGPTIAFDLIFECLDNFLPDLGEDSADLSVEGHSIEL